MIEIAKLRTAEQLRGKFMDFLTPPELIVLAKRNEIPHYTVVNPITKEVVYCFINEEVTRWFVGYIEKKETQGKPEIKFINFSPIDYRLPVGDDVPIALSSISGLKKLPITVFQTPPGIYFLCQDAELVYIGQAVNAAKRLMSHMGEKEFNKVYFISCHIDQMASLELALIRFYKPKLNKAAVQKNPSALDNNILENLGLCAENKSTPYKPMEIISL